MQLRLRRLGQRVLVGEHHRDGARHVARAACHDEGAGEGGTYLPTNYRRIGRGEQLLTVWV